MVENALGAPHRAVSAADVARAAGVSMQTVSRVVRGLDNVQPDTAARVRAAMTTLGYRPNRAARALRSGRFHTIGVIMFSLSSYGNTRTLEAIAGAAADADFTITLLPVRRWTQGDVSTAFDRLTEQAVDGIVIVIESHIVDESEVELPSDIPVVVLDSTGATNRPVVDTDQAQGARLATEHLLGLGHETVWHVTGPHGSYSAQRRETSWRETLEAAGRPVPATFAGDWSTETGYRIGLEIARRSDITAVFAANDQTALGILRACHELGRAVPRTLSVVGFDDMAESDSFWPPLTTVHQSFDEIGRDSIRVLLEEIAGREAPRSTLIPTRLVVRDSTAAPPA
jgi:DNA-binding LacI/PurR family transcriptional regulator